MAKVNKVDPRQAVVLTLREELGFTNKQTAKYLGVHPTNVSKIATGSYKSNRASQVTKKYSFQKWDKESVIEAGKLFIKKHGRPPVGTDFEKTAERHLYPTRSTVQDIFGKWSEFMLELGYYSSRANKPFKIV